MAAAATAIAVSSTNAAIAAEEAARAREEHRQACLVWMPQFKDAEATVDQRQAYAECVDVVYPTPIHPSSGEALLIKVIIVSAFVGVGFGAWWIGRDSWADASDRVLGGMMGAVCGPLAVLLVIGAYFGVKYVFS